MTPDPETLRAAAALGDRMAAPAILGAIETLLKEDIHPEVRRYLRGLYLDRTNAKVTT